MLYCISPEDKKNLPHSSLLQCTFSGVKESDLDAIVKQHIGDFFLSIWEP